jgi:branched-chain amino acid transport system substrate-binding protein
MRHTTRLLLAVAWLGAAVAHAQPVPIVIGQSLPLSGPSFPVANRVQAGAKALVDRVNAQGGIHGRPLELVALDDGGDRQRLAVNVRRLVQERRAVAIVNCLGEAACDEAAAATRALDVPLIGPFSGAASLRLASVRHVFTLRPDDRREADALVRQLQAIAVSRVALFSDGLEPSRAQALAAASQAAGLQMSRIAVQAQARSVDDAFAELARLPAQALVLDLGPEVLDVLSRDAERRREGVPAMVATMSSANLTQLTRLFRDRIIGFTSVVPNPEVSQLPVVREFERDADAYVGPEAFSFEGLASYLHLRLCVEALRRAGPRADPARLGEAIESLGELSLGGLRLHFGRDRHHGSDLVEIGLRSRDGKLRR